MDFGPATYGLGLIAGALSTLSPCVLPLVPVLIASAVNAHRWGVIALAIGLALSFMIVGLFLATVGASLGLDPDTFRTIGAIILALFGLVLLVPKLQELFAHATSVFSTHRAACRLSAGSRQTSGPSPMSGHDHPDRKTSPDSRR